MAAVQSMTHQFASILPSFDHVLAIEAECATHAEPQALAGGSVETAATGRLSLEREFRLEDVWFSYETPGSHRGPGFVLRDIDLPIEAGVLTAVVGPMRGRLLLDDRELAASELRQWRRQVGYVGQETVLFHQSVRDNLLWAKPEATGDDLREALLQASAGFVYELPGGVQTVVGDRGILLSSGQRQRISLARALLRKPTLLILDEATNALDVENEARILDAIREVMRSSRQADRGALTVLMIAHRPSAVRRADRIFELEDGRVTRCGTWEELNRGTQR
jgi:ATP-binding cassette subfamily C protein